MVKGEEIMPVPGGDITSSEIWQAPVEEVLDDAIVEADAEEAVEEYPADDLSELS